MVPSARIADPQAATPLASVSPAPSATSAAAAGSQGASVPSPPPATFSFGQEPSSNYAGDGDPVTIYAASLSPTLVRDNVAVNVSCTTSTNAKSVDVLYGTASVPLAQTSSGHWQAYFTFRAAKLGSGQSAVVFGLRASKGDGSSASIQIPGTREGG